MLKVIMHSILFFMIFTFKINAKEPLLFIVNHPGSAPYLYFDKNKNIYRGVIPDILKNLIETNQLNVKFISNSRKRSEEYIYQGNADLIMLSKAWVKKPAKIISTIPLHQHRSFLYQTTAFSDSFSLEDSHESDNLCTRKGFFYPNLAPYLNSKRLIRLDSSNHLSMLKMLFKNRCDYVVLNEFNALNLINSSFFEGKKLYRSKLPVSVVPLNIILRANLMREKQVLDKHIRMLIRYTRN